MRLLHLGCGQAVEKWAQEKPIPMLRVGCVAANIVGRSAPHPPLAALGMGARKKKSVVEAGGGGEVLRSGAEAGGRTQVSSTKHCFYLFVCVRVARACAWHQVAKRRCDESWNCMSKVSLGRFRFEPFIVPCHSS